MSRIGPSGPQKGPEGQRHPDDPIAAAAAVLRIATGESDEKTEALRAQADAKAEKPKTISAPPKHTQSAGR